MYLGEYCNFLVFLFDIGKLELDDGRKIMFVLGCLVFMIIVKLDGGFIYDIFDMVVIRYRLFDEKADWLIYVVDVG